MVPLLKDMPHEEFWIILLNYNFNLIKKMPIAKGGLSQVYVDTRLAIKEALLNNATIIALCHNHPSGN